MPREVDAGGRRRTVPLYRKEICPGNASFENRAMVSHAQMTNTFYSFPEVGPGGGSVLWRNWQVGRLCAMDGALLKWREGFGDSSKNASMAGPKKQKARQTALSRKKVPSDSISMAR